MASKLAIVIGGIATFTATASSINTNNDIFRYQWMKRGNSNLPDKVLGVNGTVLTIPNVNKSDEGQYYCTVTNEWGRSVESNDLNFTVYGMYIIYIHIYIYTAVYIYIICQHIKALHDTSAANERNVDSV